MKALEQAGYLAHYQSTGMRRRIAEALSLVDDHPEHTVCVSWGKDSTVLYHLAREHHAVHGRYREEERFPDLDSVRDSFEPKNYAECSVPGAWDMFERAGSFFFEPETPGQRETFRWYHNAWSQAMLEATGEKVILGIRREESSNRSRLVAMRGQSYQSKTQHVVLPLANWSGHDIWSYLAAHNLPYARIYDVALDRVRERSDFTFGAGAASHAIWRHGAWESWKQAYPEQFYNWVAAFPEIGRYA